MWRHTARGSSSKDDVHSKKRKAIAQKGGCSFKINSMVLYYNSIIIFFFLKKHFVRKGSERRLLLLIITL